jgi:hypothetical protein
MAHFAARRSRREEVGAKVGAKMRSRQLDLGRYETDKVANGYLDWYDAQFQHLVEREITLLEIGVRRGGSLRLWRDYFPKGKIVGVDVELPPGFEAEERIQLFQGSQGHEGFLDQVAATAAPDGFDVMIDDASHIGYLSKRTFWLLFDKYLKPSGLYAIEDWGTGYWGDWPDGRTFRPPRRQPTALQKLLRGKKAVRDAFRHPHSHGMVGFVKELIDEQGAAELTRGCSDRRPARESKFEKMVITPSIVFVTKRAAA